MSLPDDNPRVAAVRRGRLTPDQQAEAETHLASHPEQRAEWDAEVGLNYLLDQVPDVPVSSNFTARVMEACRQSAREQARAQGWRLLFLRGWIPKLATATAGICLAAFCYHQHQLAERREFAQSIVEVSKLASGTSFELLQHFDAIQKLSFVPAEVDRELIAALQ